MKKLKHIIGSFSIIIAILFSVTTDAFAYVADKNAILIGGIMGRSYYCDSTITSTYLTAHI